MNRKLISIIGLLILAGCANLNLPMDPTATVDSIATYAVATINVKAEEENLALTETPNLDEDPQSSEEIPTTTGIVLTATLPVEDLPTPVANATDESTGEIIDIISLIDPNTIFPEGDIKIYKPGNFSRVTSPLRVTADVVPDANSQVLIRLVGEDGRTLAMKRIYVTVLSGNTGALFSTEIEFEIVAMAEAGRIEISTTDEFGRLRSFNSIDVVLMSIGQNDINYQGEFYSEIIIQQPFPNMELEGDTLIVSGIAQAFSENPIELLVVAENGEVIATGVATLVIPGDHLYGLFVGEIKYQVEETTQVRLIISIPGSRIPGTAFVKSLEVVLSP